MLQNNMLYYIILRYITYPDMIYFRLYYHTLYEITFYHVSASPTAVSGRPSGRADWPPLPRTRTPSRIELLSTPEKMTDSGPPLIPHNCCRDSGCSYVIVQTMRFPQKRSPR